MLQKKSLSSFIHCLLTLLFLHLSINAFCQNKIEFAGYEWSLKHKMEEKYGPGPNYFSASENHIRVNENGSLILQIHKYKNKGSVCAEIISEDTFGYGTYIFEIEKAPFFLNKNIVIGLFTYDSDAPPHHNEIDIEFSRWGKYFNQNSQYVLHNADRDYPIIRFRSGNLSNTSHAFSWYRDSIVFRSYRGFISEDLSPTPYFTWVLKDTDIPQPENQKVHINFWLTGTRSLFFKSYKVAIRRFEFKQNTQLED